MVGPEQQRLRKKVVGGMVAGLLILAALVFGAFWPATVLGVNADALQSSVDILNEGSCERIPGDRWRCFGNNSYYSQDFSFEVEVDGFGCWHAYEERPGGKVERSPSRSGCVRIANYLS